jgi:Leucine-rich repeat (LRR) protein
LYLQDNNLIGDIPEELSALTALTFLGLSNNGVTGSIPKGIHALDQLTLLDFGFNSITGLIPDGIAGLELLMTLTLSNNQLTGTILQGIANLDDLTYLNVENNRLTGVVPSLPFKNYTEFCGLQDPTSPTNHFTCQLPKVSTQMCHSAAVCARTHAALSPLALLQDFQLCLHGPPTCPVCTGKSVDLVQFECTGWVQFFDATGGSQWTDCSTNRLDPCSCLYQRTRYENGVKCEGGHITSIYLEDNNAEGGIPVELSALSSLGFLAMPSNKLNGTIPNWIGERKLDALTYLNLAENQFHGSIPQGISKLGQLAYLSLHHNPLTGSIPEGIAGLNQLTFLYLGHNLLTGIVPNLPWQNYTYCVMQWPTNPTNKFVCPLPPDSNSCTNVPPTCSCIGASANLVQSDCSAWTEFYDATGGSQWTNCSGLRNDPCACRYREHSGDGVTCSEDTDGLHITQL